MGALCEKERADFGALVLQRECDWSVCQKEIQLQITKWPYVQSNDTNGGYTHMQNLSIYMLLKFENWDMLHVMVNKT